MNPLFSTLMLAMPETVSVYITPTQLFLCISVLNAIVFQPNIIFYFANSLLLLYLAFLPQLFYPTKYF